MTTQQKQGAGVSNVADLFAAELFADECYARRSIPRAVTDAVVRQCGGWDAFREIAPTVARDGADSCFQGFITSTDNAAFVRSIRHHLPDFFSAPVRGCGAADWLDAASRSPYFAVAYTAGDIARALVLDNRECAPIFDALAWDALDMVARAYVECLPC